MRNDALQIQLLLLVTYGINIIVTEESNNTRKRSLLYMIFLILSVPVVSQKFLMFKAYESWNSDQNCLNSCR